MSGPPDKDLYAYFCSQLDPAVAEFMAEIEKFAGARLCIEVQPPDKDTMSTRMEPDGATILVPQSQVDQPETFNKHSACHELIHVHRYWREGVPKVGAGIHRDVWIVGFMQNFMEHISMAEMEKGFGYDPVAFQDVLAEKFTEELERGSREDAKKRQPDAYIYILAKDITSPRVYNRMIEVMKRRGFKDLIKGAVKCRELLKQDRKRAVRQFFEDFSLFLPGSYFHTFDIQGRQVLREPV